MKKISWKSFISGFIVATILLSVTSIPFASGILQKIEVAINTLNISINGDKVASIGESYTLQNGQKVPYSILFNGTTYLPLRKIGELLNKEVMWDNLSDTAIVNDKANTVPTPSPTPVPNVTTSSTTDGYSEYVKLRIQEYEQKLTDLQTQINNAKNQKTVRVYKQNPDGTWGWEYTYDKEIVDRLQKQYDDLLMDYKQFKALNGIQ